MALSHREKLEALRVRADWEYACNTYYMILNRDPRVGGMVPLVWSKAQRRLARAILGQKREGKPIRIVLLKTRQFGGSTVIQSFLFWLAQTRRTQRTLTVGHKETSSHKIHGMARGMFEHLPRWLRPMVRYNAKTQLYMANPDRRSDSQGLQSHMLSDTAGDMAKNPVGDGKADFRRSETFNLLHLSEVAFWPAADKLLDALLSSVPYAPGTAVFLESTANRKGDAWYRICQRAAKGESEFAFVFIPWFDDDANQMNVSKQGLGPLSEREQWLRDKHGVSNRQIAWRRFKLKSEQFKGDESSFLAEYPEDPDSCFLSTEGSIFGKLIRVAESSLAVPEIVGDLDSDGKAVIPNPCGHLRVYEVPQPGARYAVGADPGQGLRASSDPSVAVVIDALGNVAAVWEGQPEAGEFGYVIRDIATWYNNALAGIERNACGVATIERCLDVYPNLYTELIPDGRGRKRARVGWMTSGPSKHLLVSRIRSHLWDGDKPEGHSYGVRDAKLIGELGTFVSLSETQMGAGDGCHDDHVMAWGIALMVLGDIQVGTVLHSSQRARDNQWAEASDRLPRVNFNRRTER